MRLRIAVSLMLIVSILFMPFWFSVLLALIAMLYFPVFWEAVALFFLSDLLFGAPEVRFLEATYIAVIISAAVLLIIEFLKKKIKFYPSKLN